MAQYVVLVCDYCQKEMREASDRMDAIIVSKYVGVSTVLSGTLHYCSLGCAVNALAEMITEYKEREDE